MTRKVKLLLTVLILGLFFPSLAFCQYAVWDAKHTYIEGPEHWHQLGLALNETAFEKMAAVLELDSKVAFEQVLESYDILRIENNTPAIVLDINLSQGKAKVTVIKGLQRKFSGWIPLEWLPDYYRQPIFSTKHQFVPYDYVEDSPIYECTWGYH